MPGSRNLRSTGNALLDRLPAAERDELLAAAERIRFTAKQEVYGIGATGQPVYFPVSGVFSLLLPLGDDGDQIEVAVVDSEGMLGIPCILGMNAHPLRALAQVPGECVGIAADRFFRVLHNGGALDHLVRRFLAVSWQAANQNIACGLRHTVRERTCRWLLCVHDRAETDEFEITREVLAGMVGASRQQVTAVTGQLRAAGYITYQRARVRVIDRIGLEKASCECYRVLKTAHQVLTT